MRWNLPLRHFSTASSPFLATSYFIFFFLMNVERSVWLIGLSGPISNVRSWNIKEVYTPSTIRTLIGGTMLGSVGFAFLIRDGDVTFSVWARRLPEPHLDGDTLALVGDVSIAPVLFPTWRVVGEVPA